MAIIIRIELKLQDYCGSYFAENSISTGNANAYFQDNNIDLQNPKVGAPVGLSLFAHCPAVFRPSCVCRGTDPETRDTPF
jgi:hypothetical protein